MNKIIFHNMNESNKEEYYWIYRIGLIKFDLETNIKIMETLKKENIYEIIYLSKLLYIHIQEGYHLLHDLKEKHSHIYKKFIDTLFTSDDYFIRVMEESDFNNMQSDNNIFMKNFRGDAVHYKNDKNYDKDKFYSTVKEIKEDDVSEFENIFNDSLNLEMKAQMIQFNINFIELGYNQENYSKIILKCSDLMKVFDAMISNFINNH